MALLYRANLNVPLLTSNVCHKFSIAATRFKEIKREQASVQPKNELNPLQNNFYNDNQNKLSFREMLLQKKKEAYRSIVVQVQSESSLHELHKYCSYFGHVTGMHYYRLLKDNVDKPKHFFLIEFQSNEDVHNILSKATYIGTNSVIPVKTSMLWFRKVKATPKLHHVVKTKPYVTKNEYVIPSDQDVGYGLGSLSSVSTQLEYLYSKLKLSNLEMKLRFQTIVQLEQNLRSLFPNINIVPFGSSVNGFGKKMCDLDILLCIDEINKEDESSQLVFHSKLIKQNERLQTQVMMSTLADIMQHFMPGMEEVRKILNARVPIVKFHYAYTGVDCDLSLNHRASITMTELLCLFGEIDYRVRPLVLAVRKWAQNTKLTSSIPGRTITNFPLTLLVLFYLQQKKILPPISLLERHAEKGDFHGAYDDYNFLRDVSKLPNSFTKNVPNDNLGNLLSGFFKYYLKFNFCMNAICLREGKIVSKFDNAALCIRNPLDKSHNVSKNVSLYELNRIINVMQDTVYKLETNSNSSSQSWGILSWFLPDQSMYIDAEYLFRNSENEEVTAQTEQKFQ